MKKLFIYTSKDSIEFSKHLESYLNNPNVEILEIQYQVNNEVYSTFVSSKFGSVKNATETFYTAFITYIER
ncbi:hypothetical protein HO913_03200 [Streptococcus suis]|nr:hypothetical protein [Streptococcus suis]NQP58328.1 hypothetical protein [Streptococcus suis]